MKQPQNADKLNTPSDSTHQSNEAGASKGGATTKKRDTRRGITRKDAST